VEQALVAERAPQDSPELYLDLVKRCLVSWIYPDWAVGQAKPESAQNVEVRGEGKDWPAQAHTMIGIKRLNSLHECVEAALRDHVPGDLLEAGVWRGGAAILMRAVLQARGITSRRVWVADSFRGFPSPNLKQYPQDNWLQHEYPQLAIPMAQVQENFRRYGLLDDQVRFLEGWFKDTLPTAPIEQLAVLRLDGDLYESTMDVLTNLYDKLSPGGFLIVDDFGAIPACAQAVHDFRSQRKIIDPIVPIDWTGVYWRKGVQCARLASRGWAQPAIPGLSAGGLDLPPILQPPIRCPEDVHEGTEPRPDIGCRIEDLRKQYRPQQQRKPVPVTVASLTFDPKALGEHLSRALAHQDVECELLVESNGDNHITLAQYYNKVIDSAQHDVILFCHPDVEFSPWGISAMLRIFTKASDSGAVGLVGITVQGLLVWSDRRRLPREVSTLDACIMMIDRRQGLRFDEKTLNSFHCVVEDYCIQVQKRGLKAYVAPGVTLAHFGSTMFEQPGQTMGWISEALHYIACLEAKWPGIPFCTTLGFDTGTLQIRQAYQHVCNTLTALQNNVAALQSSRAYWVAQKLSKSFHAVRHLGQRTGIAQLSQRLAVLWKSVACRAGQVVKLPFKVVRALARRTGIKAVLSRMLRSA
jgi:hypothetical protein